MTRQMADDEVLRVLDDAARDAAYEASVDPDACEHADRLTEARAAFAALQAERDALRGKLAGETARAAALEALAEQSAAKHNEACEWAERDRAALEALRGQVAGLLNTCVDVIEEGLCASQSYDYRARAQGCAERIKELLAIKERMG